MMLLRYSGCQYCERNFTVVPVVFAFLQAPNPYYDDTFSLCLSFVF